MQTDPTVQEKFWNRIFKLLTQRQIKTLFAQF